MVPWCRLTIHLRVIASRRRRLRCGCGVAVVAHDWGGRAAYTLAALWPERLASIAALALGYQPRGRFVLPDFAQCQRFWYQWLLYVDAGADAVIGDPIGFARRHWERWSPSGWFDEAEFGATASVFRHPDWSAITLNAYRSRFHAAEPVDPDATTSGYASTRSTT
jgi:pimeloyl-ACP methyl ester carboxylesterase